eukprot:8375415-Karenia_brevis.AAC.1
MKAPNEWDCMGIKRAARYLKGNSRAALRYEEQHLPKKLEGWVDSDHAGDAVTRKSTSGLVFMIGGHCLGNTSTVQAPIGLSSGEVEYYACVKGGRYLLGMKALMQDGGLDSKLYLHLKTDSSAAKGFASRR